MSLTIWNGRCHQQKTASSGLGNGGSDMGGGSPHETQAAAAELVESLRHRDMRSGIHLARLILADEPGDGSAYRLFICALTRQLRRWSKGVQAIREDDVVTMLRSAARELLAERWEE